MANFRQLNAALKEKFPGVHIVALRGDGCISFSNDTSFVNPESVECHPFKEPTERAIDLCVASIEKWLPVYKESKDAKEAQAKEEKANKANTRVHLSKSTDAQVGDILVRPLTIGIRRIFQQFEVVAPPEEIKRPHPSFPAFTILEVNLSLKNVNTGELVVKRERVRPCVVYRYTEQQ